MKKKGFTIALIVGFVVILSTLLNDSNENTILNQPETVQAEANQPVLTSVFDQDRTPREIAIYFAKIWAYEELGFPLEEIYFEAVINLVFGRQLWLVTLRDQNGNLITSVNVDHTTGELKEFRDKTASESSIEVNGMSILLKDLNPIFIEWQRQEAHWKASPVEYNGTSILLDSSISIEEAATITAEFVYEKFDIDVDGLMFEMAFGYLPSIEKQFWTISAFLYFDEDDEKPSPYSRAWISTPYPIPSVRYMRFSAGLDAATGEVLEMIINTSEDSHLFFYEGIVSEVVINRPENRPSSLF